MLVADNGLRVQVLGPLRAFGGGPELTLGPARQRAVFAMLAARANNLVPRHKLIDGVWGTSAPARPAGSLHTYVSALRRALGPARESLVSGAGYCLRLPEAALDADAFDRARTTGQQRFAAGDWAGARAALDGALRLWQGAAYLGVPGPFAELERQRLAELRLSAQELRARASLELGEHAEAAVELADLVREHPWHESLRELLMLALHRAGRHAEALEAFHDARRTLVEEQGIEPGPALRELHRTILAGVPAPPTGAAPAGPAAGLLAMPAQLARAIRPGSAGSVFVGRTREAALLRGLVGDVLAGRGRAVWIEGEAGIGKSSLLSVVLPDAGDRGCQLAWAVADELGRRFPLQVIMDCLDVDPASADPARAELAAWLHGEPPSGGWGPADQVPAAVAQLLGLVDRICARAPLVLVIDDLQWADEASIAMWHRLVAVTRQLPLLLVAATRPDPGRRELARLRRAVEAHGGPVLPLVPLPAADTERLIGHLVGAPPGASLRALAERTAGNPLYTTEVARALVRQDSVRVVDGLAEVDQATADEVPGSLLDAVGRTLGSLPAGTREVLRSAALLGVEFGVGDLAAVTGKPVLELVGMLDEMVAAGVVTEAGDRLAFRHPVLRQALYESIAEPVRPALHRHVAEALAGAGAPVTRVADHLMRAPDALDGWAVRWLAGNHAAVTNRAPMVAIDLLHRVLDSGLPTPAQRGTLGTALVKVLFRLGRTPEADAERALASTADPAEAAELREILAALRHRRGDTAAACALLREALDAQAMPEIWRTRHHALLANFRRGDLSNLDVAEKAAHQVHTESVAEGEPYPVAHSLQTLWLIHSIRRDHEQALHHVDSALEAAGDRAGLAELRLDLLDNRMFTLQNLDRLADAEATLHSAREVAARHELPTGLQVSAAVHHYWTGRWDEVLVELDAATEDGPATTFYGMREPGPAALLLHGVAALIAGRRDDRAGAAAHLNAAEAYGPATESERESCDFYLVAAALAAEQQGEPGRALELLTPVLRPDYAPMMLRHQWLPYVVRLALDAASDEAAREALAVCEEEAEQEVRPARAFTAAAHCRGLLTGDPAPVLAAAAYYRAVGRTLELASALEDAGVLLAAAGRPDEATRAFADALELFGQRSAHWDILRTRNRMRAPGLPTRSPSADGNPARNSV